MTAVVSPYVRRPQRDKQEYLEELIRDLRTEEMAIESAYDVHTAQSAALLREIAEKRQAALEELQRCQEAQA